MTDAPFCGYISYEIKRCFARLLSMVVWKNISFDRKCWLNCPHCRDPMNVSVKCMCACVLFNDALFYFWEFGQVEPFSTQERKREAVEKRAKSIKWNNTWKFNSMETFGRRKQRNCTWIEQRWWRFWLFNAINHWVARIFANIFYLFGVNLPT